MDRKEDLHNMVFAITLFPKQSVAFNKARILGKIHVDLSSLFIQRPDNLDTAAFEGKEQPELLQLFPPDWRLRCTNWAEEPKHLLEEEIEDKDVAVVKINDSEDPIEDGKVVRSLADELLGIVLEEDMLLHLEYRAVVYRGRLNLQIFLWVTDGPLTGEEGRKMSSQNTSTSTTPSAESKEENTDVYDSLPEYKRRCLHFCGYVRVNSTGNLLELYTEILAMLKSGDICPPLPLPVVNRQEDVDARQ
eukprot:gene1713-2010_t